MVTERSHQEFHPNPTTVVLPRMEPGFLLSPALGFALGMHRCNILRLQAGWRAFGERFVGSELGLGTPRTQHAFKSPRTIFSRQIHQCPKPTVRIYLPGFKVRPRGLQAVICMTSVPVLPISELPSSFGWGC